ncbi:50S ribosomal protein L25 [Tissierella creatinini]|nr:50S ribosomal protein L25 [Tissierella creatinini]TJX64551.1 50S ribosomal protein L25 [Soehngenia saccharolytica]
MSSYKMKVELRQDVGSNKVRKLRNNNILPGVIYSRGQDTKVVGVNNAEFIKVFKDAGSSSIIYLDLNGESIPVIAKDVQRHPLSGHVTHIDFQRLKMDEKIKMNIPIVLLNRDNIKLQPSLLLQLLDQVEIECLPTYIPKTADIDVEDMDFTTPKFVKDTDIASMEGITVLTNLDEPICSLSPPATGSGDEDFEVEEVESNEEITA